MSIRKKPGEAVPVLLALLHKAEEHTLQVARSENADINDHETNRLALEFKDIEKELDSMKNLLPKIKKWEDSLTEQFCVLERELDDEVFSSNDPEMECKVHEKLEDIKEDIKKLRSLISTVDIGVSEKLRTMSFKPNLRAPLEDGLGTTASKEWVDLDIEDKVFKRESMSSLFASYHCLESSQVKMCLLCLAVFPENSVIQKKPLIYWWMGEGLVTKKQNKTAEEVGEQVFQELLDEGFIRPSNYKSKSPSVINSFVVFPWVRRMLILLAKENGVLMFSSPWTPCNGKRRAFLWQGNESNSMSNDEKEEDLLTVLNVSKQYLGIRPEWVAKLKKVEVLQLGRWQDSAKHHIEVENEMLLKGLGSQKHLKYLSLRGISRIETLPPSIVKLISLQILDLRACHNLEKLPPGIAELKNLTHLDVSECYLLESMPKGLEQLIALQVLKGFVLGKAEKNSRNINDLARSLKCLRKLSIRVGHQGKTQQEEDQLGSLYKFSALRILTISWGVVPLAPKAESVSLPQYLTKLDLRCMPFTEADWLCPRSLPKLEKLYIKGGKLRSLQHKDSLNWKVNFLRLKYLKELKIDKGELVTLFPEYLYLERTSCHKLDPDITLNKAG